MKTFYALIVAAVLMGDLAAAEAASGRVAGVVREAGSGKPIPSAQVKLEGPGLAGKENSQVIRKVNPLGGYSIDAPPGSYDLWVLAPNFQELKLKIDLASGANE